MDFEGGALVRRWQHGPGTDEPLGMFTVSGSGGSAYDLHADRLGSILRVVEAATGTVAVGYDYQTFGLRTATGVFSQRYAFTGREADDESGLLYYRARYFDPATGMFLQRDPIGFAGGDLNQYAYVWNDPVNWTDPSGLRAKAIARSGGGSSTMEWLSLATAVTGLCAATNCISATQDAFQAAYDHGFNSGWGSGANGNPPPPVGGGILAPIASGLGALIGNAFAEMNRMWEQYINESRNGGSPGPGPQTGPNSGSGTGTGTPPPPGGSDDEPGGKKKKPSKDLQKGDQVDLSKFTQRVNNSKDLVDPKTGWRLSPDRLGPNSHGGSAFKLFDPTGKIRFTLDAAGKVLRG